MSAQCKSCGADIIWAKNANTGKVMPLDAQENRDGNCVLLLDGTFKVDNSIRYIPGQRRHKSHFATCPNAPKHRRPR